MILIGLTGKGGAGKDTAADYLVTKHGFVKLSMAGPLKAGLAAMGFEEPADRAQKEQIIPGFTFSWRQAAQRLGTEFGRHLDAEIWIKVMRRKLMGMAPDARVVISDIRFHNEAQMVQELMGEVILISGRQADLGEAANHASENGAVPCDWEIDNAGALERTYQALDNLTDWLVSK